MKSRKGTLKETEYVKPRSQGDSEKWVFDGGITTQKGINREIRGEEDLWEIVNSGWHLKQKKIHFCILYTGLYVYGLLIVTNGDPFFTLNPLNFEHMIHEFW